ARYYIDKQKNKDDYNIITGGFDATDFAVGMRKSDKELQTKINEAFEKLYKEGKMQEISKKWFGDDEIAKQ
ncbi:transporter substrate-binding domain-containing protein, partial [Listeria monocytogenes]|nr:transporter substrate-binding domain-containing protein [Listeria monocytogenes]HAA8258740.1 amino acid ABC transporter substrate-binding protein [Listeria monocytogenes]HAA8264923.1 amino acid ABC transporter substrate-binding protein [Listeria monocytogenes]